MNPNEELIRASVHDAVIRAVTEISADAKGLLEDALARETNETAKSMLSSMVENLSIAKQADKAVCQSPGYPTAWLTYGDENMPYCVKDAIAEAVAEATKKGYLRPSMVDPLTRVNSGNNTGKGVPNIEYEYVPGQKYVDFIISFKGCGAELGNAMQIMTTAKLGKNLSGLKRFILETAINAGGKPCPPYGIGIGIGGQMDVAAKLSRKAISTRQLGRCESRSRAGHPGDRAQGRHQLPGSGRRRHRRRHRLPGPEDGARPHPHRHRPGLYQLPLLGRPPGRHPNS